MANAKKAAKAAPTQVEWPASINLRERFPSGHVRAGELRYGLTKGGKGRIDMMSYRDVPQHLVDAALAVEAEAAEASQQAEAA